MQVGYGVRFALTLHAREPQKQSSHGAHSRERAICRQAAGPNQLVRINLEKPNSAARMKSGFGQ